METNNENAGAAVPEQIVALVNRLGAYWTTFPSTDGCERDARAQACVNWLRNEGAAVVKKQLLGGGFRGEHYTVLGGFEVEGRNWVVWAGKDDDGVEGCGAAPCETLTRGTLVAAYGEKHGPDHYRWAPSPADEADQWEIYRARKEKIQTVLHLKDWREGSRAIGHDGPYHSRFEDYVEVPVDLLLRLARLVEADLAYSAAEHANAEAKRARGNYNPNPLPASHPLSHARRAAAIERHEALAPFMPAAEEVAS